MGAVVMGPVGDGVGVSVADDVGEGVAVGEGEVVKVWIGVWELLVANADVAKATKLTSSAAAEG